MDEIGAKKFFLVSTILGDPFGGPAEVEKVFKVEMDDIGARRFWASTIPGDPFGGPAKAKKVIRVKMDEIGTKKFFWLVLYWVTLLEDRPR